MSHFTAPKILTIAIIVIAGYFAAPYLGLESLSLALGLALGAILAAALTGSPRPTQVQATQPAHKAAPSDEQETQAIFVGNLAFRANRQALTELFSDYGQVINTRIVTDKNTRKPRGYGFVEMSKSDAAKAIAALNGAEFYGRTLNVNAANERKPRTGE